MKKVLVASLLLVVFLAATSTPALAADPPAHKPGSGNNPGLWNAYFKISGNGYSWFAKAVVDYLLMVGTPPNWWR
jgi:hypothetical protein